ncbi:hypothetical protein VF21_02519 [Pseudogymnoascus sp. 05NY08]|nr:hypothetical protein VF21_02519 [Pseudogymnoascus sp. 05NY08]
MQSVRFFNEVEVSGYIASDNLEDFLVASPLRNLRNNQSEVVRIPHGDNSATVREWGGFKQYYNARYCDVQAYSSRAYRDIRGAQKEGMIQIFARPIMAVTKRGKEVNKVFVTTNILSDAHDFVRRKFNLR